MSHKAELNKSGISASLGAAFLFGAGTPLAKLLLTNINPWLLAGLFYLGSGIGLSLYRRVISAPSVKLPRDEMLWFAGAIVAGGIVAPVLLMLGLAGLSAANASLLLNAEAVFTTLLAWFVFKENFDRRIALGITAIVTGTVILSWPNEIHFAGLWPSFAILAACFAWGIDNNLTRKVSLSDATWIASVKGLIAGSINLILAFWMGAQLPSFSHLMMAMTVGFFAYGVSLTLFVIGLRHLGTARTGAYFSVAPFFGAVMALVLGEPITMTLLIAGALMAFGVWLHVTEHHVHDHIHDVIDHSHEHVHDEHHQHVHNFTVLPETKHSHLHHHAYQAHAHPHYPEEHHQHRH